MNILIVGGAGFIGSHLTDKLQTLGHNITIIDDLSNGSKANLTQPYKLVQADITQITIQKTYDAIYYLACYPRSRSMDNPRRDLQVNVDGLLNMLEYARKTGGKIIYASNTGIYNSIYQPLTEETPDNPTTPYDMNKKHAEEYIKLYHQHHDIPYTIFRFATVYGPRQQTDPEWQPVIATFAQNILKGKPCRIDGEGVQTRDFIHVSDIVEALIKPLLTETNTTYILGTGIETSINQLHELMTSHLENAETTEAPQKVGDINRMRCLSLKALKHLLWKPNISLEDGITQLYGYLSKQIIKDNA